MPSWLSELLTLLAPALTALAALLASITTFVRFALPRLNASVHAREVALLKARGNRK